MDVDIAIQYSDDRLCVLTVCRPIDAEADCREARGFRKQPYGGDARGAAALQRDAACNFPLPLSLSL